MKYVLPSYSDKCAFKTTWKIRSGLKILRLLSSTLECSCSWLDALIFPYPVPPYTLRGLTHIHVNPPPSSYL